MPIATCFLHDEPPSASHVERLTELWSDASGVGGEHMTINLVAGAGQSGASYRAMALLHLPTLWSPSEVRRLQVGLAVALAEGLAIPPGDVHVMTSLVKSGHVVEDGETQEW